MYIYTYIYKYFYIFIRFTILTGSIRLTKDASLVPRPRPKLSDVLGDFLRVDKTNVRRGEMEEISVGMVRKAIAVEGSLLQYFLIENNNAD